MPSSFDAFSRPPSVPCFDTATRFCPCVLADLGHCVACSLLRGENRCHCGWGGVCVYEEYVRSGERSGPPRHEWEVQVRSREWIAGDLRRPAFWFQVDVSQELSSSFNLPGSFAIVRSVQRGPEFGVPLSVMMRRENVLTFACEVVGPKTIDLERAARRGAFLMMKGPFWSGLQGIAPQRVFEARRTLVVAKGIGQAPAVFLADLLASRGVSVKLLAGPGSLGTVFAPGFVDAGRIPVEELPKEADHNLRRILHETTSYRPDLVVSCGGEAQHRALWGAVSSLPEPPLFAWTSEVTMNCAEGICGACLDRSETRLCKGIVYAGEYFAGEEGERE